MHSDLIITVETNAITLNAALRRSFWSDNRLLGHELGVICVSGYLRVVHHTPGTNSPCVGV
jgi:hypothetical protein